MSGAPDDPAPDAAPAPQGVDPAPAVAMLAAAGLGPGAARDVAALILAATLDGVDAAAPPPPGPKLFMANHQIALDLLHLAAWLNGPAREPARIMVWDGFGGAHPGEMVRRLARLAAAEAASAGGVPLWLDPILIDTRDAAGLGALAGRLLEGGPDAPSVVIASEGLRQDADGARVRRVGMAFVDAALAAGAPIVPARFCWALPETPLGRRLAWPHRLAPMRVALGPAIPPEALAPLPLGARRDRVAGAIDGLRRPAPPGHDRRHAHIAARVARLQRALGLSQTKAMAIDLTLTAPPGALSDEGEELRAALLDETAPLWRRKDALAEFGLYLSDALATAYPGVRALYRDAAGGAR